MESKETLSLEAPSELLKGNTQHVRQGLACGGDWGLQSRALTLPRRTCSVPLPLRNCCLLNAGL